ncbi:MAG TPA: flagellar hook-basal body complex protein [Phycisphaerae bacterium]|nr:flagellar hook-basal body complex protein [Phycisphaerae bacterium]
MSSALMSGVTGLRAHETMLDVAGNNLANLNTYGYKAGRVGFAEQLAQTLREATQPTSALGGTNPQQIGSGVTVGSIDRNMAQGTLVNTGGPLDLAMDGKGFFVVHDGKQEVYTRVGHFAIDADYNLVDPSTGYRVQRIGSAGVAEGFQSVGSDDIRIPYDVALPAKATNLISYSGNLSADANAPTRAMMTSGIQYKVSGAIAGSTTALAALDQTSGLAAGDTITISGADVDGTPVNTNWVLAGGETLGDLVAQISGAFTGATAVLDGGEIQLQDDGLGGYSRTDLLLAYTPSGAGTFELPGHFEMLDAGGNESRTATIEVFDTYGKSYVLSVAFVRTDTPNTWDAVVMGVSGGTAAIDDRRITGISFNQDGSYGGTTDTPTFTVRYGGPADSPATLNLELGTTGQYDGLSQFGGSSTVAAATQDGYEAGYLSSLSVSREGDIMGMFTNGVRRTIASIKVGTFQNPAGLLAIGDSYYQSSSNSGDAIPTRALAGGAGAVTGGSLERSNVEVAQEFVNLIEAQNGFQANARTIKVTNDMLRELSNLIR